MIAHENVPSSKSIPRWPADECAACWIGSPAREDCEKQFLDNGPEFRGRALAAWSEERGVRLAFNQPGRPVQNAHVESFNGRLRDECLNAN
jgi:hypothetical protein